jgi:DNA-directed RNA polymerase specialized sigma subunit
MSKPYTKYHDQYDNHFTELRIKNGYTENELSKILKVTQSTVSQIGLGMIAPFNKYGKKRSWVDVVCKLFKKDIQEIWPFDVCGISNSNMKELTSDQAIHITCGCFTLNNECTYNKLLVNKLLSILKKRNAKVIVRYVCDNETMETIGQDLGLTRGRIEQIVNNGLYKMWKWYYFEEKRIGA